MALTEREELELLELEEKEAMLSGKTQPQAQQPQESTGSFGDELTSSLGKRAAAIKDIASDSNMGMPRKLLRGAGEIAGGIVDVPIAAMKSGLAASTNLPIVGKGLQAAGNLSKQALSGAMNITNEIPGVQASNRALSGIAERNPEAMRDLEALVNIGSVLPVGKLAGVAREAAAFGTGKGLQAAGASVAGVGRIGEKAGKAILKGEAKINKNIAQKAAGNFTEGKQKIIDDIAKFNLQSTKKGFAGIVDNADAAIEQRMTKGSEALKKVSAENPNAKINLDGVTARYRDELKTGKTIPFDEIERADAIREEITDKLKEQLGFDINDVAELTLEQADEARKLLSKGVFKKGAFSQTDPIRDQIKQDMALKIRDKMADYVPELTKGNKEIRDLINVKKAADEAATRISGNNQIFGMGNMLAGGAGTVLGGNPVTGLAMVGAKKALESGRGASGLISAGKGISATGEKISGLGKRLSKDELETLGKINLKR